MPIWAPLPVVAGRPRFFFGVPLIDWPMKMGGTTKTSRGEAANFRLGSNLTTNTPVDTTRRRFLAAAAVASAVGAGSLAAAARAPDVPQAATTPKHSGPDPVFGLIEAHRQAGLDHDAALVEQR